MFHSIKRVQLLLFFNFTLPKKLIGHEEVLWFGVVFVIFYFYFKVLYGFIEVCKVFFKCFKMNNWLKIDLFLSETPKYDLPTT
jgi:hypothetical protein